MLNFNPLLKAVIHVKNKINPTTISAEFECDAVNQEITLELIPEICSRCNGTGKVLYGSLEGYAFTESDFVEDPDLHSDLQSGMYDRCCPDCSGHGCVLNIDKTKEENKEIVEAMSLEQEYINETKMERKMGA